MPSEAQMAEKVRFWGEDVPLLTNKGVCKLLQRVSGQSTGDLERFIGLRLADRSS